jgi:hypothetical protein
MKIKRKWQERFAESINKEQAAYKKEGDNFENRWILTGMKDTIYLLGAAINKEEYSWASGFQKFCKELGVNFER